LAITAAIKGKAGADIVEALIASRVSVDSVLSGFTPLLRVCDANPFSSAANVARALIKGGANVNFAAKLPSQLHYTPLAAAIQRGHSLDLVSLLLNNKANPNVSLDSGPVITHAVIYELNELTLLLIKAGVDVNVRENEQGSTPLASAISNYSVELVRALVDAGADRSATIVKNHKATARDLAQQLAKSNPDDTKFQEINSIINQ